MILSELHRRYWNSFSKTVGVAFFGIVLARSSASPNISYKSEVDWPAFMARHDMTWNRWPDRWQDALWFGNGLIGTLIWREGDRVRVQVFRGDVTDHRSYRVGYSGYSRPRLQIGSFYIKPRGKIVGGSGRLTLLQAEFTGEIVTDVGRLKVRHLVHSLSPVIFTEITGEGGETDPEWVWKPAEATPTRPGIANTPALLDAMRKTYDTNYFTELYKPNPPSTRSRLSDVEISRQVLLANAEHSVAWLIEPSTALAPQRCYISIACGTPERPEDTANVASTAVDQARRQADGNFGPWLQRHRAWWQAFYQKSFLSLSDTRAETVYWTQMYKLGSAARNDSPIIDHGLWQTPSPWTFLVWDLNVQLSYWPVTTSNHLDLGQSLIDGLWNHREGLIANVPVEAWRQDSARAPLNTGTDLYQPKEADMRILDNAEANLTWAMHDCYMIYRRSMNDTLLREKIYPLLRRAVNNQIHHLYEVDGRWHMPATESPEYGMAKDANYELAALRWGCQALLDSSRRLGLADPQTAQWQDILQRLTEYPADENGYRIGADEPFRKAHRHASHLLMIYPYATVNIEQPENRGVIRRSVQHFYDVNHAGYEKAKSWNVFAGYTYTFLAAFHAMMGEGDEAERFLNGFIDYPLVAKNAMYAEAGPVIETPLSAAQCMNEMVLQSWGDKIRVFPAVPSDWPDVVFDDLLAEGGFEVSAERRGGATRWVRIKSLAGEPCRIRTSLVGQVQAIGAHNVHITPGREGVVELDLHKDESVVLYGGSKAPPIAIRPVAAAPSRTNWYGLKED